MLRIHLSIERTDGLVRLKLMLKLDLQNLDETSRVEMLGLATESLDSGNSQFSYASKQYIAVRTDTGGVEVYQGVSSQSIMRDWPSRIEIEFKNKVKTGKESSNPDDRKFTLGGIYFEIKEPTTGSFTIHTSLVPTPSSQP